MPMCKKCKEVFGAQELKAGYCEKCYTPELEAQDKKAAQEKEEKKIRFKIKAIAIFIFVMNILVLFGFYNSTYQYIHLDALGMVSTFGLIAGSIGLFLMKKWGAYLVMGILLLDVLVDFGIAIYIGFNVGDFKSLGIIILFALLLNIVKVIFILTIYEYLKKSKNERRK